MPTKPSVTVTNQQAEVLHEARAHLSKPAASSSTPPTTAPGTACCSTNQLKHA